MAEAFEIRAKVRYVQIAPQKARLVVDVVRGMGAEQALDTLRFMPHKAAKSVYKLIESAVANAEQNYGLEAEELFVHRIFADDGPRRKSGRFGGRGRFKPLIKRSCHISVVLAEREAVDYE
ncbi:MAG: 50S ribosomal protein L22 [Anaerolineales bacterium]|nr:50S ribosomal protein L22 [Anaerolineales bacterium]MCB0016528.1 50S ribosomal protein L22 [Anaerolineales bacterium]MCB0029138.1 50S ribosomal protein L22 [Anaerolineales bacterium]MCB8959440.1 50S ribosomal protein L22 [Ardenticatenales bacterium]